MEFSPKSDDLDTPRLSATLYSLTLEEAGVLFREAGLPRNLRSLQRYCAGGRLDCIKEETVNGLQYFVDPESVIRAITQLAQLHGLSEERRQAPTEHDNVGRAPTQPDTVEPVAKANTDRDQDRLNPTMSQSVLPQRSVISPSDTVRPGPTVSDVDGPKNSSQAHRPAATSRDENQGEKNIEDAGGGAGGYLQDYVDLLKSENSFLRQQVSVKDEQIADLLERDRESNILVQGLQKLLQPLLRGPDGPKDSQQPKGFDHGQS